GLLILGLIGQRAGSAALGRQAQPATVTSANQTLPAAAGPPALLLLSADALVLSMNGDATMLAARVRDAVGRPVPGVAVSFQSNLGSVAPASATTDAAGLASATFTSGGAAGQAV